ncbi:hypothetical protein HA402_005691 [Bradysia odoriphaga]|nr:hypothetical protein HA402_005691 [Bradysia odoriphaga]
MYTVFVLVVIAILCQLVNSSIFPNFMTRAADDETTCGYKSCHPVRSDVLNVHLIAHTHDDVGWLKTADQYYYGGENRIQKAAVDVIIDSAVDALLQDPSRRFIYVEMAFFSKWWNDQDEEMRDQVRMLVNEGRLEFIGGAWSMNDEAGTHYQSIIDQFSVGLKFLNDTFGECGRPKVGWQIDPFGHSREQASLFAQMGFDGFFVTRLDYQDKQNRLNTKTMEVVWKSSENLDSDIFTGALYNEYANPPGFCFDILCDDEPIIDDVNSPDYNVDKKAAEFAAYAKTQGSFYRTNNILITMGEDFYYMSAVMWFKNMDKIIKYTNEHRDTLNVNLIYSTPSCYLKALYDANIDWPTKTDDYFPYASDPNCYWTGYFTSRPNSKRFERLGNQFLQVCKKLSATATTPEESYAENLERLRMQMGVMQHHDAITGTEKQNVTNDYHRELTASIEACEINTRSALNQFVTGVNPSQSTQWEFQFHSCLNLNISVCEWSENAERLMVTVYNPLSYVTNQYARFPVAGSNYEVRDADNNLIPSQLVDIALPVTNLHYRVSSANSDLVFQAANVPALGYKTFFVSRVTTTFKSSKIEPKVLDDVVTIGTNELSITFDINGLLSEINVDGVTNKLSQNFLFYRGFAGNNREYKNRSSGAYIFRPIPDTVEEVVGIDVDLQVIRGDLVDEVHQVFNDWISQVVRIYKTEKYVEFEWLVGPIPVDDDIGKEIVSRFTTDINNAGVFYTDSNGREMIRRKLNTRGTWNLEVNEPIAGNYYPINAKIVLEEGYKRLAILTDRSQGGSSMIGGTLEIMVHRRLLSDDAKGVGEALNETAYGEGIIARGKHYLIYSGKTNQIGQERLLQNEVLMSNWLFFDDVSTINYNDWQQRYTHSNSFLKMNLPRNVHLMSFEPWKNDQEFLIRFEHLLDAYDDAELSKPVHFDLKDVFPGDFHYAEVSLAGNQWIEDSKRLRFRQIGLSNSGDEVSLPKLESTSITLEPMQIRTFIMMAPNVAQNNGIRQVICTNAFVVLAMVILKYFLFC